MFTALIRRACVQKTARNGRDVGLRPLVGVEVGALFVHGRDFTNGSVSSICRPAFLSLLPSIDPIGPVRTYKTSADLLTVPYRGQRPFLSSSAPTRQIVHLLCSGFRAQFLIDFILFSYCIRLLLMTD